MEIVTPGIGLIFWMLVIFGLVFFIAAKYIWPQILSSIKKREDSITEALESAREAREQMAKLEAEHNAFMQKAKDERDAIMHHARAMKEEILEEAKEQSLKEGQRIIAEAQKQIQYEKLAAMAEVKTYAADLAIQIAEKLMRAELSDKQKNINLINRLLQEAEQQKHLN